GALQPGAVSAVLVVFGGSGSKDPDAGVRLHVRATDPEHPVTASVIGLASLLECLQDDQHRIRGYVILDAVDIRGQPVGPTGPKPVPVLTLGRGDGSGRGLAEIWKVLAMPPQELVTKLPHWGPLSLQDLHGLVGGELVEDEHSPARQVGLIPSPLAWPREGTADDPLTNWCAVISDTDARRQEGPEGEAADLIMDKLAAQSRNLLNREYRECGHAIELAPNPSKLLAGNVLSSPRSFAYAVAQVCHAELA